MNAPLKLWLDTVLARSGGDILAIQTLRNAIMSASVLASAALVAQVAVLAAANQLTKPWAFCLAMQLALCASLAVWAIVLLAACGFKLQLVPSDTSALARQIALAFKLMKMSALLLALAVCLAALSRLA